MPRQTNEANQIWYEKNGEVTNIGFTNEFLNTLDQCWHILPSNLEKFKVKSPLLTIETNDALLSIVSPVSGNFMEFSNKAQNFPNKLTENDVVLSITDRPAAARRHDRALDLRGAVAAQGGFTAAPTAPRRFAFNEAIMTQQQQAVLDRINAEARRPVAEPQMIWNEARDFDNGDF